GILLTALLAISPPVAADWAQKPLLIVAARRAGVWSAEIAQPTAKQNQKNSGTNTSRATSGFIHKNIP
ncbi:MULTISPECIES: hypothetical protein, partial [Vibrio]|uniref:hypothetical protein n=1 Tax=Vibrio TaxID=662 RepID=UPI001CDCE4A7